MVQPINYITEVVNPLDMALRGAAQGLQLQQQGLDIQEQRAQSARAAELHPFALQGAQANLDAIQGAEQRAAEMQPLAVQSAQQGIAMQGQQIQAMQQEQQAQQAQIQRQQDYQAAAARAAEGGVTHAELVDLTTQYPEMAEGLNEAFSALDEGRQRGAVETLGQAATLLNAGDSDGAIDFMLRYREAAERAGDENGVQAAEVMIQLTRASPEAALFSLGMSLQAMDPDTAQRVFDIAQGEGDDVPASFQALELRAEAAGLAPGTPEYQQFMIEGGAQNGMDLTVTPEGGIQLRQGSGAGQAPRQTVDQSQAAGFLLRAEQSAPILNELEEQGTRMGGQMLEAVPFSLGNLAQTEDRQRYQQARRDFINLTLRRESGAVISDAEFANADQQYFPQPGDGPAVIEQKRRNREAVIEGLRIAAGGSVSSATPGEGGPDDEVGIYLRNYD